MQLCKVEISASQRLEHEENVQTVDTCMGRNQPDQADSESGLDSEVNYAESDSSQEEAKEAVITDLRKDIKSIHENEKNDDKSELEDNLHDLVNWKSYSLALTLAKKGRQSKSVPASKTKDKAMMAADDDRQSSEDEQEGGEQESDTE